MSTGSEGLFTWALAIADPCALDVLVTAAATDLPSVRRAAAKGLGTLHWSLLDADQRSSAQAKAQETLLSVSHPDWSILLCRCGGLASFPRCPI